MNSLVFIVLVVAVRVDVEVAELVGVVSRSNHSEPVTEVVLLQVPLCQVFQVPLGESNV